MTVCEHRNDAGVKEVGGSEMRLIDGDSMRENRKSVNVLYIGGKASVR